MQVFSKMDREEQFLFLELDITDSSSTPSYLFKTVDTDQQLTNEPRMITYVEYMKTPNILSKSTIKTLKATAQHLSTKSYRVHKHGNKPELIERLRAYFDKWTKVLRIQHRFREFLATRAFRLRGPAYFDLSKCVNDIDFFTMDPLSEIDRLHLYSYADAKGFVYGFDVFSLIHLYKREGKILNPYTREEMNVREICSLFRKIRILHPDSCVEKNVHISDLNSVRKTRIRDNNGPSPRNHVIHTPTLRERRIATRNAELEGLSIERRIEEVFIAIDRLGNYTQSNWFSELSKNDYYRFYQSYYDWWNRLPVSTKRDICYVTNPFSNIRLRPYHEVEIHEYREACLALMEHMVYTGADEGQQALGALHVLRQLTRVSYLARNALPWLVDSV